MGIIVQHLSRKRKNFMLEDINFSLPEGYILGVIGRNGSGKSTFFETLLTGLCPNGGTVVIDGTYQAGELHTTIETQEEKEQRIIEYRKQFAFVFDQCPFPEQLSALDIADIFSPMYENFDRTKYLENLRKLDVPTGQLVKRMSQGMKLKVQIAFAFSYSSKVLLLDEPSAHLDTFSRKELYQMIYDYMEDGTHSVIWATHLTDELDRMADYLLLLDAGNMIWFDQKDDILSQYMVVKGSRRQLDYMKSQLISRMDRDNFSEGLVRTANGPFPLADETEKPTIEQLLCYLFEKK